MHHPKAQEVPFLSRGDAAKNSEPHTILIIFLRIWTFLLRNKLLCTTLRKERKDSSFLPNLFLLIYWLGLKINVSELGLYFVKVRFSTDSDGELHFLCDKLHQALSDRSVVNWLIIPLLPWALAILEMSNFQTNQDIGASLGGPNLSKPVLDLKHTEDQLKTPSWK